MTALLPRPGLHGVAAVEMSADTISPVTAALRLRDRLAFILESVEGGARYGRYSMVGVRWSASSAWRAGWPACSTGTTGRSTGSTPATRWRPCACCFRQPSPTGSLPISLASGVGYLAYEAAARWETAARSGGDPIGLPEALFHLPDVLIVFDHLAQTATLAAVDGPGAEERLADTADRLSRASAGEAATSSLVIRCGHAADRRPALRDRRGDLVRDIRAGEMLQAVLARRFSMPCAVGPWRSTARSGASIPRRTSSPWTLGPAARCWAPRQSSWCGCGTPSSPRGPSPARDPAPRTRSVTRSWEVDLLADAKELAEHAMLVDLARNDVGRVAEAGPSRCPPRRHRAVLPRHAHRLGGGEGRGRDGLRRLRRGARRSARGDGLGAPKVRAMQIIEELEPSGAGPTPAPWASSRRRRGGGMHDGRWSWSAAWPRPGRGGHRGRLRAGARIRRRWPPRPGPSWRPSPTPRPSRPHETARRPETAEDDTRTTSPRPHAATRRRRGRPAGRRPLHPPRRQLRLVHLQPLPVPLPARRGRGGRAQRRDRAG